MMITKRGLEQGYCSISDGGLRTFYLRASGTEGWELSTGNAGRGEDCGAIGSYRTREAWRTPTAVISGGQTDSSAGHMLGHFNAEKAASLF